MLGMQMGSSSLPFGNSLTFLLGFICKMFEKDLGSLLLFIISSTSLLMGLNSILFGKCFRKKPKKSGPQLPPGPIDMPYFGCILQVFINKPTFRWIHWKMEQMNTQIFCIKLGKVHVITVTSPELAREFLKRQDNVFASRPICMSAELTSRGYLSAALVPMGEQWKKMRRVLSSHVLSSARHKWLHDKRAEEADHLLKYVYNQCGLNNSLTDADGGVVNVRVAAQHYCGNVIRKLIFNVRFFGKGMEDGGPGKEEVEHVDSLFTILNYLYSFCVTDYFPRLRWITDFDGHERTIRKAIESVLKYHDHLIDQRIQQWKDGIKKIEEDLLDVLINLKDPILSPDEIKAQIVELMIATVDNPSNAIEWALAEMINQPRILRRATEELDRVVGRNRLVQESDLPGLNFIKACVREAFRLHPVAPFNLPHVSNADTEVAGYFIPKGSHVLLSRPGLGRNPTVWEDSLRYEPERHLGVDGAEVVLTDHELRMLSFSTGRRGCAGVLLGSTMTAMLLTRLVQGFSWELLPSEIKVDLTEARREMLMAKPLMALARPRLPHHLYPMIEKE